MSEFDGTLRFGSDVPESVRSGHIPGGLTEMLSEMEASFHSYVTAHADMRPQMIVSYCTMMADLVIEMVTSADLASVLTAGLWVDKTHASVRHLQAAVGNYLTRRQVAKDAFEDPDEVPFTYAVDVDALVADEACAINGDAFPDLSELIRSFCESEAGQAYLAQIIVLLCLSRDADVVENQWNPN